MANPFDNIISPHLKQQFKYAIDELIRSHSVPCRLYYPITAYETCTNCSNLTQQGPNPFLGGERGKFTTSCNICGGNGKIPIETTETIVLPVIFNSKKFDYINKVLFTPAGDAQTFSKISTIKQIKTCKYIVFNTDKEGLNSYKYTREDEPQPLGFGGEHEYILTTWKVMA